MRSVVLGYHGVADSRLRDDMSRLLVTPRLFETHVQLLKESGFEFVTFVELARRAQGGIPPAGLAAITFDDGMRNNHSVALPILQAHGISATVYVTTGFMGDVSPWVTNKTSGAMLRESEIRELAAAGWEVGGHTVNHPDLSLLDYDECRREIVDGRDALQQMTQVPVETFAYPFGRYGEAAVAAVRDSGFKAAVTIGSGCWDPYEMTRAMISALDPMSVTWLKLTDRYEPLLGSAPMRAVRKISKGARSVARSWPS
jgi:peptidoglycan/xylan/chitin deacetylase (PgdA/CDA1 family)